jgi:hypothetical protein
MGALVGVKGIEPNMRFRDGVTVRCLTLRRHSRVLVVLRGIDPRSLSYQLSALPLSYRTGVLFFIPLTYDTLSFEHMFMQQAVFWIGSNPALDSKNFFKTIIVVVKDDVILYIRSIVC